MTQNSKKTLFFNTNLVGKTSKTSDVEEPFGIWIMFAEFGSFYLQSDFNATTL